MRLAVSDREKFKDKFELRPIFIVLKSPSNVFCFRYRYYRYVFQVCSENMSENHRGDIDANIDKDGGESNFLDTKIDRN